MPKKSLKLYKALDISEATEKDAIYCIKANNQSEFTMIVTDMNGQVVPLKDLTSSVQSLVNDDGTIQVDGLLNKTIRINPSLVSTINSALQLGDPVSSLLNDAGYLTVSDLPTTFPPSAHTHPISDIVNLQTELDSKLNKVANVTIEPNVTKTLAETDEHIRFTNANPVTFTIPTNTSVPIPVGTSVRYTQEGDGVVTLIGVGITFVTNLLLATIKGETRILTKIDIDTWTVQGSSHITIYKTGQLSVFKNPININEDILEAGDMVTGIVEGMFINASYLGGDTTVLTSFDIINQTEI